MSIINKIKEAVVEYTVFAVLGGIAILAFIIWSAVPSTFWEKISDAIEKKVLWASVGLLFLIAVGEFIYILQAYFRAKTILRHFGGVLWNSNSDIFCPKDEAPLYQTGKTEIENDATKITVEIFQCPKCDSNYILKDSDGKSIPIAIAKKNFLIKQSLKTKGSIEASKIEESFDEVTVTVLRAFGGTTKKTLTVENFTGLLNNGTKPVHTSHSLDLLHKKGYLTRYNVSTIGHNDLYELTPQGRAYIVTNNLI